jgi:hypothetical protein
MHPGAMQKHGGEDVRKLMSGIGNAYQSVPHWRFHARRQVTSELSRNQAEIADGFWQGPPHARTLDEEPDQDAQRDDADCYVRASLSLVFVAIGEHRISDSGFRSLSGHNRRYRLNVTPLRNSRGTTMGARKQTSLGLLGWERQHSEPGWANLHFSRSSGWTQWYEDPRRPD